MDLNATVAQQARRGYLEKTVLVPARRNLARLVVLVDVSSSMVPWLSFNSVLVESLRESQLASHDIFYFSNVPYGNLYRTEALTRPVELERVMKECHGAPLLMVSDAGAARGFRDIDRIADTEAFIKQSHAAWPTIAWLNPMPRARWAHSSAETIAGLFHVSMFELNDDGLIEAVDVLRGRKAS